MQGNVDSKERVSVTSFLQGTVYDSTPKASQCMSQADENEKLTSM